ncbi:hypothetical protein FE257_004733 [Aspergillus nanangensis]|uniref:Uncharacterized protein n=1 Tax=Aspergillus nanangensis TaxID=2582783 RepID=A0AAD4CR35_ASPNN|nr:hypothetical protein FE257_004733 [Aspergillus nanangensis]
MFRRRRSTSHHQPLSSSSAQSAQSAASRAFLNSQPSSSSLSSAAAAAALRSLTPTPTPVENVQTKRMVRRRASITSQSSGLATALRPSSRDGLRRARSSSSMGSRTFRDQSPRGPASRSGSVTTQPPPPLPSLPREYTAKNKLLPRRSISVSPAPGRPMLTEQRPASSGGRDINIPSGLDTRPELQRAESRNSINFSYPRNSRPNSPTWSTDHRDVSADASLVGQLASPDSPRRQNSISSQTANTSARRKNKTIEQTSLGRAGGTAVAAAQAAVVPRNEGTTLRSPSASPRAALRRDRVVQDAGYPPPVPHTVAARIPEPLDKKPVVEDLPTEGDVNPTALVGAGRVTPDNVRPAKTPVTPEQAHETLLSSRSSRSDGSCREPRPLAPAQPSSCASKSARFYTQVAMTPLSGDRLHRPPPRSVSPAKSAMKNSRKSSSLSPEGRTATVLHPGPLLSEISDATSVASDDGSKPAARRKPVKVSFDDEAEVVGVAASPPTSPEDISSESSPPGKMKARPSWFGVGKGKSPSVKVDGFDEVLKPRPALPSFGSIRGSKNGQPSDIVTQEFSDNESTTSSEPSPLSFSNDHAISGALHNAPLRGIRKITSPERAPSPAPAAAPAAATATDDPAPVESLTSGGAIAELGSNTATTDREPRSDISQGQPQTLDPQLEVPELALQPATPELEHGRSSLDWYTVPGGFPRSSIEYNPRPSKPKGKRESHAATTDDSATGAIDGVETDDESGESIYSDAEEAFEGHSFGSINAIVDDGRAGVPQGPREDESYISNVEQHPDIPELPETCKIARAVIPTREAAIPEVLGSPHQRLPFPASNPPPAPRPTPRSGSTTEIPRSTVVPTLARRSVSVDIYDGSPAADVTPGSVNGSVKSDPKDGVSFFRRSNKDPVKKRSLSWGPALLKGVRRGSVDDTPVNEGKPSLQRQLSNESDSSSSFKRSHRPRADPEHIIMRRTLRSGPPSAQAQPSKPRLGAVPSSRPLSSSGPKNGNLRSTLRTGEPRREKPTFFSTGKARRAKNTPKHFTSRFAESDDEAAPSGFRSRYADSSDEEGQVSNAMRPVRGIPRRKDMPDGDSTELEDSSDNDRRHRPAAGQAKSSAAKRPVNRNTTTSARNPALAAVAKSRGMTENEMDDFLHQPSGGRRPGLLQRLSLRKPRSPARRGVDKTLENQKIDEKDHGLHGNGGNQVTTTITANNDATASSSKLRKGAQKTSGDGENWPLNEPSAVSTTTNGNAPAEKSPPKTNGVGRNGSATVEPIPEEVETPPSSASPKLTGEGRHLSSSRTTGAMDVGFGSPRKKRFPRLRRAFGMN